MLVLFAVLGLALSASAFPFSGTVQSVAVHGKLLCNGKPYEHAKIKLFDVDFGKSYRLFVFEKFTWKKWGGERHT